MKIFIAGSRSMRELSDDVRERLSSVISANGTVLVGDARGADMLVQKYLKDMLYPHVNVYASGGNARNNIGDWKIVTVQTAKKPGTFDFFAAKDRKMAEDADYGLMIWDGKSKGTLNDTLMLADQGKPVVVYYLPLKRFITIKSRKTLSDFISVCGGDAVKLYHELTGKHSISRPPAQTDIQQFSLFDKSR